MQTTKLITYIYIDLYFTKYSSQTHTQVNETKRKERKITLNKCPNQAPECIHNERYNGAVNDQLKEMIIKQQNICGGNRCVFSILQKTESDEQERRLSGSEFHIVGAPKAKERRPSEVRRSGTVRRLELEKRRLRYG
jgi:hypothetical protein